jgi:ATP-binding cassette subfamily B protein
MLRLMRETGLKGKVLERRKWGDVIALGGAYPAMVEQTGGDWVIAVGTVTQPEADIALAILDPRNEQSGITITPRAQFESTWTGRILLCKRKQHVGGVSRPFGLRWFAPEIMRHWKYLRDVALAATMCNIISFAIPMLFNIMIDKVVPHHSYPTLFALVIAFLALMVFDGFFGYVRQYLMLFATNKIDANLASRTFDHLLNLPMQFFESHTTGVLIRHMQQTESVRGFLTGRLFNTLLEASALPMLLVGLSIYSGKLTMVVLGFSSAMAAVIGLMIPAFRQHLENLYQAEGMRQADLVETIHGMRAIKSLALEPGRKQSWDRMVANSVRARFTVGKISMVAMVLTNGLEKMMTISVLGLGVASVFNGDITIGTLVAFNMLSGRVTGPLVQIVSLINEYQQTALAVKMLGQVMDHAPERDPNFRGTRPFIGGELEFDNVTFRYEGTVSPALNRVSFSVQEGQVIGIVGRSGSGKTTVTRMIQGIHTPEEGLIRLNGNDIRHIDLGHLRRNIGVVLQDNLLFRGTIRDNIAATRPDARMEDVMVAARLAGADEFIDRLPRSYETFVEENATNFSGGQRQRIAIARTLLSSPRLLIFDEATSALDPESEAIIQRNLAQIATGRTLIIVSHRLSSLVRADLILVLDRGGVVDFAPHDQLVERCDIYRNLWQQQTLYLQ